MLDFNINKNIEGMSNYYKTPPQMISKSKKNKEYLKRTVDNLENIGLKQIGENLRFRDFYRMIEGKMSFSELKDTAPQLSELSDIMDDLELDNQIEHFDIIGTPINALIGEYMRDIDKYSVYNTDSIAISDYQKERNKKYEEHIKESFQQKLKISLIKKGLDPNVKPEFFKSQEEYDAYIQSIEKEKKSLNPDEIESYMSSDWKTKGVLWGKNTLKVDSDRFDFREIYKELLKDYLGTGRAFLHYLVSGDYYKPERWSPLNTFFSQEVDNKYPQHGEYIGRISAFTLGQINNRWGNKLSKIQKEKLNNSHHTVLSDFVTGSKKSDNIDIAIAPHKSFFEYESALGLQDALGVPIAERTTVNKEGENVTYPVFLPQRGIYNNSSYGLGEILTDNQYIRKDLIQVTEVYFTSYEEIGYLRYRTETGLLVSEIITKDINKEFLKYHNIKNISSLSLTDALHKYKGDNIVIWDYIPKVYKGVKISNKGTQLSEPIYIDLGENEFQLKGDSNTWDLKHPVASLNTSCLVDRMLPYQKNHNIVMNEIKSLLQKELGIFWLFDVKMLPSDLKGWGDTEETLLAISEIVKDTGLFPLDMSRQNLNGGGMFNQFAPQNMSLSSQIADRLTLAERYKWMAYEKFGFNPQRLGAPSTYETKEGVMVGQQARYAQTEDVIETFNSFRKKSLEMHLSVAQYAKSNNKDFTFLYTGDNGTKEYLKLSDSNLPFRVLNISIDSSSKEKEKMQLYKQIMLNNNTLGADMVSIAEVINSESVQEALNIGKSAYNRALEKQQMEQRKAIQISENNNKALIEKEKMKLEYEKKREKIKIEKDILVAQINATGRASDKKSDNKSFNEISETAQEALNRIHDENAIDIKKESNQINRDKVNNMNELAREKLKIEKEKLRLKEKEIDTKKYTSEINKN